MLTIGRLAALAGTTPNTLRYYEREGLVAPAAKGGNGYRLYDGDDAQRRIGFIRQARQCGFTLAEIRELLTLRQQAPACRHDVRRRAIEKKLALEARIRVAQAMSTELDRLIASCCAGDDDRAGACPILEALDRSPEPAAR